MGSKCTHQGQTTRRVGKCDWRAMSPFAKCLWPLLKVWYYTVSQKCTNFETVWLKIIRINFAEIWQKYSRDSRIEFACFSFYIFFMNFSSLKPDTENNAATLTPFSKEDKILIKNLCECKGYNARQFIKFPDIKVGRRTALMVKSRKFGQLSC